MTWTSRPLFEDRRGGIRAVLAAFLSVALAGLWLVMAPVAPAKAAGSVTVTPLGWNVVGLDSNDVNAGPNQFPVGGRVCNSTGGDKTLTANWEWLSSQSLINLAAGSNPSVGPFLLADGACRDVYWTVEVTRNGASYLKTRNFRIGVDDGSTTIYTPNNRQIYVEKLVSQNRNSVSSVTGPGIAPDTTPLLVGNEYTFTVKGSTATNGYEQSVFATIFDPSLFEIVSVSEQYSADTSAIVPNPNDQVYGDGCGWVNDYTAPNYRSCTGTGKVGGNITTTYKVRVIGAGTSRLVTEIYDFSGASYHYNADFGAAKTSPAVVTKAPNPALTLVKSSDPVYFTAAGEDLTYTLTATNSGDVALTDVSIVDSMLESLECDPAIPVASLAPGASVTCTGTYTTTQEDVEAGSVINAATAAGKGPNGAEVSADAQHEVPGPLPAPDLSLTKSSDPATFDSAGETLNYTITASNTGNVTLKDVVVTDDVLEDLNCPQGNPVTTLAPGDSVQCTGSYLTTVDDVEAGQVRNVARAEGTDPGGEPLSVDRELITPGPLPNPALSVVKTANEAVFTGPDETIQYTVTATNSGNVKLTGVEVSDSLVDSLTCDPETPVGVLLPGESIVCIGEYLTTQGDFDNGEIENLASATGTPPQGGPVTGEGRLVIPSDPQPNPSLVVVKTADPSSFTAAGTPITFTVWVVNNGNVTISDITVEDPLTGGELPDCYTETLPPGVSMSCETTYTTTEEDVQKGGVTNTATASGTDPKGDPVEGTGQVFVPGPAAVAELAVTKTSDPTTFSGSGQTITYEIIAANTGTVPLTDVTITDPRLESLQCDPPAPATLDPGEILTCTGAYETTQGDVNNEQVTNTATATGKDPNDQTVEGSAELIVHGFKPSGVGIDLAKSASPTTYTAIGDEIQYKFVITNTGKKDLDSIALDDPLLGGPVECPKAELLQGESMVCTAIYLITEDDIAAGEVLNTATVTGMGNPGGPSVEDTSSFRVMGPPLRPAIVLTKTPSVASFVVAGAPISYTLTATNTGNVPLTGVTIDDLGPVDVLSCDPAQGATLAPGESMTCSTSAYITDSTDVERGYVENTANVVTDEEVSSETTIRVPGPNPAPRLSLAKTAKPVFFTGPGTTIEYQIVVTNTGNVPLYSLEVDDPLLTDLTCNDGNAKQSAPVPGPSPFNPGEQVICTGTYETDQDDVGRGRVENTATATAVDLRENVVAGETTLITPGPTPGPELSVIKTSDPTAFEAVGDILNFQVVVANTGNVTLYDVEVTDEMLSDFSCESPKAGELTPIPVITLAPGEFLTCRGWYEVKQADVDDGEVFNAAQASAKDPDQNPVEGEGDIVVPGPLPAPALAVVKAAEPTVFERPNERIEYTVTAINTGNVKLTGVTVEDELVGELTCDPETPAELLPGEAVTCFGFYDTTQEDLENGQVENVANATGFDPHENRVDGTGSLVVPGPEPISQLSVEKTADPGAFTTVGETITYTVVATNTGNTRLYDIEVADDNPDVENWTCDPELPVGELLPGEQVTCTGDYTTTQEDVDRGAAENSATATGWDPYEEPVEGNGAVDVPGPEAAPKLDLTKSASPSTYSQVGQPIFYTFVVTNSGNITMTNVEIVDKQLDAPAVCQQTTLAPGASTTCTGQHAVTQADLDQGSIVNVATANGSNQRGTLVTPPATATVTAAPAPPPADSADLALTKSNDGPVDVGKKATFTLTVTNNGPGTAKAPTVTDTLPSGLSFVSASGTGWTCGHSGQKVTCTLGSDLPAGATSIITVKVETGTAAIPKASNSATVSSATPDPNPANNTGTSELSVNKLPQEPTKASLATKKPGKLIINPGASNAQQKIKVRAQCRPVGPLTAALPMGDVKYCKIIRKSGGKVVVKTFGSYTFKVRVVYSAPATKKYRAFREVKVYTVKPKK